MKIAMKLPSLKHAALYACLPLLLTASAFASEPGTFDRTLAVSGPVSIDISSGPGGVTVTAGTSRAVEVHAVIRAAFGRADGSVALTA